MAFKLAQLSDLHLDYRATRRTTKDGINIRQVDGYIAFKQCVDQIINEECDAAVICGDIFHTSKPSIRSIVFAQNQLRRLADAGVKVYALGGNHDVSDRVEDLSAAKVLDDSFRGIHSSAEPYVRYEISDGINLHCVSHHQYADQAPTFDQIKPIESEVNIFSTHGSVIDPLLKIKLHTEQSPREIVIPEFLLSDMEWDYVLLGHIHERGWIGSKDKTKDTSKKKVYYNGSTIRRGFSDKEVPLGRGWTLWSIDSSGKFTPSPRLIDQRPQYDFKAIESEGLSASDITDQIVKNLKETQINGLDFDSQSAPILRQRLVNISPAKYAALNWSRIQQNTTHSLQWSIKQIQSEKDELTDKEKVLSNEEILKSGDIVEVYDEWVNTSDLLKETDENIRLTISKQARNYIQTSQEAILENE